MARLLLAGVLVLAGATEARAKCSPEDFNNCQLSGPDAVAAQKAKGETLLALQQAEHVIDTAVDGKWDLVLAFRDKLAKPPLENVRADADKIDDDREPEKGATAGEAADLRRDFDAALEVVKFYERQFESHKTQLDAIKQDALTGEYKEALADVKNKLFALQNLIKIQDPLLKVMSKVFQVGLKKKDARAAADLIESMVDGIDKIRKEMNKSLETLHEAKAKAADDLGEFNCKCGMTVTQERMTVLEEQNAELQARIEELTALVDALQTGNQPAGGATDSVPHGDPDDPGGGGGPAASASPGRPPYHTDPDYPGAHGPSASPGGPAGHNDPDYPGAHAPSASPGGPPGHHDPDYPGAHAPTPEPGTPPRDLYVVQKGDTLTKLAEAHCGEWGCDPCTPQCVYSDLVPRLYRNIISGQSSDPNLIFVGTVIDYTAMAQGQ